MPIVDKDKKRAYQLEWTRKRRDDWINSRGGVCETCGSFEGLEVDHIDPSTKLLNPRDIWNRRAETREVELAKCQVLCKGCHSEKTSADRRPAHGTNSRYNSGCRCGECRKAHRELAKKWRSEGRKW